jgi:predicted transcriptional regulator
MEVQLDRQLVRLLEEVAKLQHRDIADVLQEAVEQYLTQQKSQNFDADVRRILEEHPWWLDELANS